MSTEAIIVQNEVKIYTNIPYCPNCYTKLRKRSISAGKKEFFKISYVCPNCKYEYVTECDNANNLTFVNIDDTTTIKNMKTEYNIQDFAFLTNNTINRLNSAENTNNSTEYEIEIESLYEHKIRLEKLLPKFTPMKCEHCIKRPNCVGKKDGVCGQYVVKIDE